MMTETFNNDSHTSNTERGKHILYKKKNIKIKVFLILALSTIVISSLFLYITKYTNKQTVDSIGTSTITTTKKPTSCISTLDIDGKKQEIKQNKKGLYSLFIPKTSTKYKGKIFAGWWTKDGKRINGSKPVTCGIELFSKWDNTDKNNGVSVPILMYHQFTNKPEGEEVLTANYMYYKEFDKQMKYLKDNNYYLPTWDELEAFIDNKIVLPKKSVIISDDDADSSWFQYGVPIINKYKLLSTSFVITKDRHEKTPSKYVLQRSHTDSMHTAGADGNGQMVNLSRTQIEKDLRTSIKILGASQVLAYPYGHYNDTAIQALKNTGFKLAVTTEYGKVDIGDNKYILPRIRVSFGETLNEFIQSIN